MTRVFIKWFLISFVSVLFIGCGGGNGNNPQEVKSPIPFTGYFIDSPVENLTYTCGNLIGITDKDGKFECPELPITFKAGGIILGSINKVTVDKEVHPQDLVGVERNVTDNENVLKIASLLLSLDDDGFVTDGIKIDDSIELAYGKILNDINSEELTKILNDVGIEEVSYEEAKIHLNDEYILEDAKKVNNEELISEHIITPIDIDELKEMIDKDMNVTEVNTSEINDMSFLFKNKSNFNQDISKWDVSNVTNMSSMFHSVKLFNQDISDWNVSSVTNMALMFHGAEILNQDLSNWDVSSVENHIGFTYNNESIEPNWIEKEVEVIPETYSRIYYTGPRGGCYYYNSNGNKTYVEHFYCS